MNQILMNFAENLLLQLVMGLQLGGMDFFGHCSITLVSLFPSTFWPLSRLIVHQLHMK